MTEEVQELFDAPWHVEERKEDFHFCVIDAEGRPLFADVPYREDANRLARLPELYDALADATRHYCSVCRNEPMEIENLVKNGCQKTHYKNLSYPVSCVALDWLELLRKVRDGK